MDKRLFVFMKHSEKARTLVHVLQLYVEIYMNRVQKKYAVENI